MSRKTGDVPKMRNAHLWRHLYIFQPFFTGDLNRTDVVEFRANAHVATRVSGPVTRKLLSELDFGRKNHWPTVALWPPYSFGKLVDVRPRHILEKASSPIACNPWFWPAPSSCSQAYSPKSHATAT